MSRPVSIPTRSLYTFPSTVLDLGKKRKDFRGRSTTKDGAPTSVAALKVLAATAIPRHKPTSPALLSRRKQSNDLSPSSLPLYSPVNPLDFALNEALLSDALSEKSPSITRSNSHTFLNVLLSPPDVSDEFSLPTSPLHSSLSIRSLSSESIPSLAGDEDGTFSWGDPLTPSPLKRPSSKLNKTFSPPEECVDHPLIAPQSHEVESSDEEIDPSTLYTEQASKPSAFSRLSFKSNLTASLRVLRSAAKTFSSLSTPLTQPDDYLTRSILSIEPQFSVEKRPKYQGTPTPALRQYLNPSPKRFSRELGTFSDKNDRSIVASIQLQTYSNSITESPIDRVPIAPRSREVRENSDFLRVIVLEMNMRRQGKLSDASQGKARFVLPPRQPGKVRSLGDKEWWTPILLDN